jgi:hypothetical protein
MRQCKCGGVVRQHQLAHNREAWTCNECGRYEVVKPQENLTHERSTSSKNPSPTQRG